MDVGRRGGRGHCRRVPPVERRRGGACGQRERAGRGQCGGIGHQRNALAEAALSHRSIRRGQRLYRGDFTTCAAEGHEGIAEANGADHAELATHGWAINQGQSTAAQYMSRAMGETGIVARSSKWLSHGGEQRGIAIDVAVPAAGYYDISLRTATNISGGTTDVYVDGVKTGSYDSYSSASDFPLRDAADPVGRAYLSAGTHTIKLWLTYQNYILPSRLIFKPAQLEEGAAVLEAQDTVAVDPGAAASVPLQLKINGAQTDMRGLAVNAVSQDPTVAEAVVQSGDAGSAWWSRARRAAKPPSRSLWTWAASPQRRSSASPCAAVRKMASPSIFPPAWASRATTRRTSAMQPLPPTAGQLNTEQTASGAGRPSALRRAARRQGCQLGGEHCRQLPAGDRFCSGRGRVLQRVAPYRAAAPGRLGAHQRRRRRLGWLYDAGKRGDGRDQGHAGGSGQGVSGGREPTPSCLPSPSASICCPTS